MGNSAVAKLLAVTSSGNRELLREKLAPLDSGLVCVGTAEEIEELRREGQVFEVLLLPEAMSELEWWPLWGELSLLNPQPSILVYTRHPTFRLWTAVLDLGGYDVVSEPFGESEIKSAVTRAAKDYRERASSEP
jgi:DNA-binding NtrC family response regulator